MPTRQPSISTVPAGSSMQAYAHGAKASPSQGRRWGTIFTMRLSLSKKMASMAKRMNIMWMLLQGERSSPCFSGRDFLPISPKNLSRKLPATFACIELSKAVNVTYQRYHSRTHSHEA